MAVAATATVLSTRVILRCINKMKKLVSAVVLLLLIAGLHFGANAFGVYDEQIEAGLVWFDNLLHFFVGIAMGVFWLWIVEKHRPDASFFFVALSTVLFVLLAALLWELVEFGFMEVFTSYAKDLQIYSPSLTEATSDVISNLAGACALVLGLCFYRKS